MGSFSLLVVAEGPERRVVSKIVKEFRRYQFSNVRVSYPATGRHSIVKAQTCDVLLIGISTTLTSGSRALTLSSCPCVLWVPVWTRAAASTINRLGVRHRTSLLLIGKTTKKRPPSADGIQKLFANEELFEYKAALEIMRILLGPSEEQEHAGGQCPG